MCTSVLSWCRIELWIIQTPFFPPGLESDLGLLCLPETTDNNVSHHDDEESFLISTNPNKMLSFFSFNPKKAYQSMMDVELCSSWREAFYWKQSWRPGSVFRYSQQKHSSVDISIRALCLIGFWFFKAFWSPTGGDQENWTGKSFPKPYFYTKSL